ncbi:hypothetical protein L596_017987 [Steinernema carpocapsae]|uniref:BRCT domain-containing protein n=1 Tax=Steinernema carpocapsae TaxID=34508 RepID=A0A4U5N3A9_STECR|nr:hypothetical protein L596_017987 [Steinernema carpocapsae]
MAPNKRKRAISSSSSEGSAAKHANSESKSTFARIVEEIASLNEQHAAMGRSLKALQEQLKELRPEKEKPTEFAKPAVPKVKRTVLSTADAGSATSLEEIQQTTQSSSRKEHPKRQATNKSDTPKTPPPSTSGIRSGRPSLFGDSTHQDTPRILPKRECAKKSNTPKSPSMYVSSEEPEKRNSVTLRPEEEKPTEFTKPAVPKVKRTVLNTPDAGSVTSSEEIQQTTPRSSRKELPKRQVTNKPDTPKTPPPSTSGIRRGRPSLFGDSTHQDTPRILPKRECAKKPNTPKSPSMCVSSEERNSVTPLGAAPRPSSTESSFHGSNSTISTESRESSVASSVPTKRTRNQSLQSTSSNDANRRRSTRTQLIVFIQRGEHFKSIQKAVGKAGGTVTDDVELATHYIADKMQANAAFLCAVARHIPIVTAAWIFEGEGDRNRCAEFVMRDAEMEKEYDFDLERNRGHPRGRGPRCRQMPHGHIR